VTSQLGAFYAGFAPTSDPKRTSCLFSETVHCMRVELCPSGLRDALGVVDLCVTYAYEKQLVNK
jgi:hypothetical protein